MLKRNLLILLSGLVLHSCNNNDKETPVKEMKSSPESAAHYQTAKSPLQQNAFLPLPLGTIKPEGWLKDQLERMASGMTGNLDKIYPEVVGQRNGWLGGDGDGWERGPYWIDGLLPLAYILDDEELKNKVKPWIEWTLNNQTEEGYIGPVPFETPPDHEPGLQKDKRRDWWPKMVMLKVLQQYYNATGDARVIEVLTKYFRYQLKELPERPLDHLSLWANRRGGDNLQVVYWLYNITGDKFLLELGDIIQEQTFPWSTIYTNPENSVDPKTPWHYAYMKRYPFDSTEINSLTVSKIGGIHTVNFAQGLKEPVVAFQRTGDSSQIEAVKKALRDVKKYHGQPQGMYGGDEPLHGTDPLQGVEFCSIAEEMFSLESMIQITGDMEFADLLEKIAYNALPTQASDDFMSRQYFQAANQIELSDRLENSFENHTHKGTDFVFGTLSGYPCCTTNMHQSWPKFVQNLFYATPDRGVAVIQYAPSSATVKVGEGTELQIRQKTGFPFRETVEMEMTLPESSTFPLYVRIPEWTGNWNIQVNGKKIEAALDNGMAFVEREWQNGDKVILTLPMKIKTSQWHEFATAIERGPLVYSLKIRGELRKKDRNDKYREFTEVYPMDPWNYALLQPELDQLETSIQVVEKDWNGEYPWNLENTPIELKVKAARLPEWKEVNGSAVFPAYWGRYSRPVSAEEVTLVPYGTSTLRITEFPVLNVSDY